MSNNEIPADKRLLDVTLLACLIYHKYGDKKGNTTLSKGFYEEYDRQCNIYKNQCRNLENEVSNQKSIIISQNRARAQRLSSKNTKSKNKLVNENSASNDHLPPLTDILGQLESTLSTIDAITSSLNGKQEN